MKSLITKHSIVLAGHKTSVSLEEQFWKSLKEIASDRGVGVSEMVAELDSKRTAGNLSSALRLFVLEHYRKLASSGAAGSSSVRSSSAVGGR